MHLGPRQYDYDDDECTYNRYTGQRRCYGNAWDNWVRWLVLALIVVGFFTLFFLCSCLTARRRRKAGRKPFYGTGWAARPGAHNTTAPYHYNNNNNAAPAPPYTTQPQSNTGYYGHGSNEGYYGQQNGVEMQAPQPTYGGQGQYAPPPGPPPGKGDGIVR